MVSAAWCRFSMITSQPRAWRRRNAGGAGALHEWVEPEIPWFQITIPTARSGPFRGRSQNARSSQKNLFPGSWSHVSSPGWPELVSGASRTSTVTKVPASVNAASLDER